MIAKAKWKNSSDAVALVAKAKKREETKTCYRCGKRGHIAKDCHLPAVRELPRIAF